MWKASIGSAAPIDDGADDWETDANYENNINEEEQRYGKGGKTAGAIDMKQLREETEKAYEEKKKKEYEEEGTGSRGYGGKFGVEKDRMDKSAVGHDYIGKVEKHGSQTDHSQGFGGKFGVQKDRMDKSAVGHDYVGKIEKHASQTDHSQGFGGKFGVQKDRMDKSAVGHDYVGKIEKHASQTDHSQGFGGKFGVQKDRVDKSAVGWDSEQSKVGTNYTKAKPDIAGAKPSNIRARFENFAKTAEEEASKKAEEQKRIRAEKDKIDREQAAKQFSEGDAKAARPLAERKGPVETGRSGGISGAISAFNQPKVESSPVPRKDPIVLPKEKAKPAVAPAAQPIQPDLIPKVEEPLPEKLQAPEEPIYQNREPSPPPQVVITKQDRPASHDSDWATEDVDQTEQFNTIRPNPKAVAAINTTPAEPAEHIYGNIHDTQEPESHTNGSSSAAAASAIPKDTNTPQPEPQQQDEEIVLNPDDPGVTAIALYDYEAAAEDEISFDPDDVITHIDMVSVKFGRGALIQF